MADGIGEATLLQQLQIPTGVSPGELEVRKVLALERIALALERLQPASVPPGITWPTPNWPPAGY